MNEQLWPEAFVSRMHRQLGEELPAFLRALAEPAARGIRLNPCKPADLPQDDWLEPVPWEPDARYLVPDSRAGATAAHEAGAFYLQEPSAMLPARALAVRPGERVLDLCAAPGGKSTQLGAQMAGRGLLVCNEPVPARAKILSRNVERMGLCNALVVSAWPEQLARRWPGGFDAVLADAPCSGEGMFRREPETAAEWSEEKALGCAKRQREILTAAAALVRPGGRLVYATCTYHPAENEDNADWFLQTFPEFEPLPFFLPEAEAPEGRFTCYPHRLRGEGQFAAAFRKKGEGEAMLPPDKSLPRPAREEQTMLAKQFPAFPPATHRLGETLVSLADCPETAGLKVLRAGVHLAHARGGILTPDHALALCAAPPACPAAELSPAQALRYLAGETLEAPEAEKGWRLLRYRGLILGWGKASGGQIKNHYPKGLRSSRLLP